MKVLKRYSEPIAQAVTMHGPVAGVLAVVQDILDKATRTGDPEDARKMAVDAKALVGWLRREVTRTVRTGGSR